MAQKNASVFFCFFQNRPFAGIGICLRQIAFVPNAGRSMIAPTVGLFPVPRKALDIPRAFAYDEAVSVPRI
ncbi:MAG: hypothetical protein VZQ29_03865 [Succiniclasticum sp.]|nr:hypothetical protein [Succiniclasticum sp.]